MLRTFNGKTPKIAQSAFVSEAAYIIGDVEVGENSSVWPGAVIRGDFGKIRIGENTAVEDNCVIHSGSPKIPWIEEYQVIRGQEVVDRFKRELEYLEFAHKLDSVEKVQKKGEGFSVELKSGEKVEITR